MRGGGEQYENEFKRNRMTSPPAAPAKPTIIKNSKES